MSAPLNLVVRNREHGQFCIEHLPHDATGEKWDAQYVSVSGYFGTNGPHVFAAAPDLLEALDTLADLDFADHDNSGVYDAACRKARAAIAKARGLA